MSLDALLLEVLACPVDKQPLLWFEGEGILYNPRLRRSYPVRDGVPVMLVEEAADVGQPEHERLMREAAAGGVPETGGGGSGE
jgi:uncharacterized protein YbaR (Trm112 family)